MKKAAALAILLPLSLQTHATEISDNEATMESMVVTATMTEKNLESAPGSIEVVTATEIEEMGATTAAEALTQATGLIIAGDAGRVRVPSIRGTGNKHTLVLIDGRRQVVGYKNFTDLNQIPVSMIERIEILRGPTSTIYGSDAIGGVINIISRRTPETTTFELNGRYGSQDNGDGKEFNGGALAGTRINDTSVLFAADYKDQDGWDKDKELPDDGDNKQLSAVTGRIEHDFSEENILSTGFEYTNKNQNGHRYYMAQDRDRQAEHKRLNYYLQYNANQNFMVRAYHSEQENEIYFTPTATVTAEENAKHWLNQFETRYTTSLFDQHLLSLGGEIREEGRKDNLGSDYDLHNLGLFLQDEIQISDPLYLNFGIRYDDHSEFGQEVTSKAAAIYEFNDNFRIKSSVGQGFKAPTISELFVTTYQKKGKYVYEPNSNLKAEESLSYEMGIEANIGLFSGEITAFRNDLDNFIDAELVRTEGSGSNKITYYQYKNIAKARTEGVELEGNLSLPLDFTLTGNITWLNTEDKTTGEELEGEPRTKGHLKLRYSPADTGLATTLSLNYVGKRYYSDEDDSEFHTVDWYISKTFNSQIKLYAGIDNIFDEKLSDYTSSYITPTSAYVGFHYTY